MKSPKAKPIPERMLKSLMSAIVGSAIDAIVSVDEEQRVVLFNAAAELLPLFADYQKKTKREIPVLTLTRIDCLRPL